MPSRDARASSPVLLLGSAAAAGLPAPPPASLDPILDAAAECFARYGVRRTTVPDVARAARTSRATVYRQAGGVDRLVALLLARELHRLLVTLPQRLAGRPTADALTAVVAECVHFARSHPVMAKILADEPEQLGPLFTEDLPEVVGRVSAVITPTLTAAMAAGEIARRDPVLLADWIVRLGLTLVIAPPPGELDDYLAEVVRPVLAPPSHAQRRTAR